MHNTGEMFSELDVICHSTVVALLKSDSCVERKKKE